MSFFEHTAHWTRGELFDATVTAGVGLLTIGIAFACWWFGESPAAKAALVPFVLAGVILVAGGASELSTNQTRLVELEQAFQDDPAAFVVAEHERVEGFQSLYTITLLGASVGFALASFIFWWTVNPHWRAAGLALVFLGFSGLAIDYVSKDRADRYAQAIRAQLTTASTDAPTS